MLHDLTALRRMEAARRDFVANVSHELKTPLTVVRGYAETLLGDEPPPDVRRGFLTSILANATRMQRLVDDLLDLSRIESGAWTPHPERVGLRAVAEQAWTDAGPSGGGREHKFAIEIPEDAAEVDADPQANATATFLGVPFAAGPQEHPTIYEVLMGKAEAAQVIRTVELPRRGPVPAASLDMLPAHLNLPRAFVA